MRSGDVRAVAAVAALVALAACGGGERAGTLPSPAPPTSVAPTTPTPTPSVAHAKYVEAVRQYYEVLEAASLDPGRHADEVAALLAPGCSCVRVVEFLRASGQKGHRIERPVQVRNERVTVRTDGAAVFATVHEEAGRVLDRSGKVIERLTARTSQVVIDLVQSGGSLLISQISVSSAAGS